MISHEFPYNASEYDWMSGKRLAIVGVRIADVAQSTCLLRSS